MQLTAELRQLITQLSQQLDTIPPRPLLEIWDAWVEMLDLPIQTKGDHYAVLRRQITKAQPQPLTCEVKWLTEMDIKPATFNKKVSYLKNCLDWAKREGLVDSNPWLKVRGRKQTKETIKPFTKEEARAIVTEFERLYPAWVPFVKFLFLSGCRLSEAIGLRWQHVDLRRGEICICETLAQVKHGNGYERTRKETKTGSVRYLKITTELEALLKGVQPATLKSDELVFKSPTGKNHVDSNNFRDRWRKVLASLGMAYRRPHIVRHSFASHAIDQGIPLTGVAYLLGHADTRMVSQTYGHLINRPSLPDIL